MTKLGFHSPYSVLRMAKLHHVYARLMEVPLTIHVEKHNYHLSTNKSSCSLS